jgi:hypothetical protein
MACSGRVIASIDLIRQRVVRTSGCHDPVAERELVVVIQVIAAQCRHWDS